MMRIDSLENHEWLGLRGREIMFEGAQQANKKLSEDSKGAE